MRRLVLALAASAMMVSACATSPDKIAAAPVSPAQYDSYNCDQIKSELVKVSDSVAEVTGQQRRKANKDKVVTGVAIVVFWPAAFLLIGGDKHDQLAHLKGQYDALKVEAAQKSCPVAAEIQAQEAQVAADKAARDAKKHKAP